MKISALSMREMHCLLMAHEGSLDYGTSKGYPSQEQETALQVLQDRDFVEVIGSRVQTTDKGRVLVASWQALSAVD